jgi:hypothetical protein
MRSEWRSRPDAKVDLTPPLNAAAAADRRFGMAKRIEQSRRHGHHDPRWTGSLRVVRAGSLPLDAPADPVRIPPTLTLVGGTDMTPTVKT